MVVECQRVLDQAASDLLRCLSDEARLLRWLTCSELPEVHLRFCEESRKTWPENSLLCLLVADSGGTCRCSR